jgi:diphthamide synthase subunit DPH2
VNGYPFTTCFIALADRVDQARKQFRKINVPSREHIATVKNAVFVHDLDASKQILGNISVESTIITRRVSEGFTPPSLAYASGYENGALSYAE